MASNFQRFFNFAVLARYRWRAVDFLELQNSGMVNLIEGLWEGQHHGAVLSGLDFVSATGLNFTVSSGIAVGPTGDLLVTTIPVTGSFISATGPGQYRQLAVIRPNIVVPVSGYITPPTMPLTTAPLFFDHYAQVLAVTQAIANNAYAATGANDVVLFGARIATGATGFSASDLDFEVRDIEGKNSRFQHNTAHYDQRLRPSRLSTQLMQIRPSQTVNANSSGGANFSNPKLFTYVKQGIPSIFPKTGGVFSPLDTQLNFQTGAITGGDATSTPFSPTIPTAGNAIVASIGLTQADILTVVFGTVGTYAQCQAAIYNQVYAGAGGLPALSNALPIAFVILQSSDGVNISDMDVIDARAIFSYGGVTAANNTAVQIVSANYQVLAGDKFVGASGSGIALTLPDAVANAGFSYELKYLGPSGTSGCSVVPAASGQLIDGVTEVNLAEQNQFMVVRAVASKWSIISAG